MASAELNANSGNGPDLHLLLADTEPLWESILHGFGEILFPERLPPLTLESKPIPVKDIWGFYNYKKNGALGSTAAHVLVLGFIIGVYHRAPFGPISTQTACHHQADRSR